MMNEAARRYASALFALAQEGGALESVRGGLKVIAAAIAESADLRAFLAAPMYRLEEKSAALTGLAGKLGVPDMVVKFVGTMARNGRSRDLAAAIGAFEELYMRQRGIKRATVRTAVALSDEQRSRLNGVVARHVGGEIELNEEVEPGLVGGIQLRVGSQLVDASLRAKLERLNAAMKGA